MDEEERYAAGTFTTYADAVAACAARADAFLVSHYRPGMAADALYAAYTAFGEDPFIVPKSSYTPAFSAWQYAKRRCQELGRT